MCPIAHCLHRLSMNPYPDDTGGADPDARPLDTTAGQLWLLGRLLAHTVGAREQERAAAGGDHPVHPMPTYDAWVTALASADTWSGVWDTQAQTSFEGPTPDRPSLITREQFVAVLREHFPPNPAPTVQPAPAATGPAHPPSPPPQSANPAQAARPPPPATPPPAKTPPPPQGGTGPSPELRELCAIHHTFLELLRTTQATSTTAGEVRTTVGEIEAHTRATAHATVSVARHGRGPTATPAAALPPHALAPDGTRRRRDKAQHDGGPTPTGGNALQLGRRPQPPPGPPPPDTKRPRMAAAPTTAPQLKPRPSQRPIAAVARSADALTQAVRAAASATDDASSPGLTPAPTPSEVAVAELGAAMAIYARATRLPPHDDEDDGEDNPDTSL